MTIAVVLGQLLYNDNRSILWASLCCIEWRHLGIALHCESRRSIYLKKYFKHNGAVWTHDTQLNGVVCDLQHNITLH
jgi:hypothetical protein